MSVRYSCLCRLVQLQVVRMMRASYSQHFLNPCSTPLSLHLLPSLNLFSLQLEAYTDFHKYPPPCSCPIIYYKLITPAWLYNHSYLTSHVEANDGKRVVFNIKSYDFPQLAYIPVLPPETTASDEDIVIDIKLSLKTPSRDSDIYLGFCSGTTCYGTVIVDNHQNWPSCPFAKWTNTAKTLSGKVRADCSGSSQGSRSNYPEEVHIRFYPKYAWISYYIAQNGGTSIIGQFQDYLDLSQGVTVELYGDDDQREKNYFQYLELEVKKNSY